MHKRHFLILLVGLYALIAAPLFGQSDSDTPSERELMIMHHMIKSVEEINHESFTQYGNSKFAQLDINQFKAFATPLSPRLKNGYTLKHLGLLHQSNYRNNLWLIRFNDGGDDGMLSLRMRDGQIGGFYIYTK